MPPRADIADIADMDPIDRLPPDLSAVLSLLLRQGRSYSEIADMLRIPESAVRERAHAALDAISSGPAVESASPPQTPSRTPLSSQTRLDGGPLPQPPASRRAGALLLGAILAVIVVVVILIVGIGGSGSSHQGATAGATTTSGSGTSTSAGEAHIDKQLNLVSPDPASNAVGLVEVVSQGSKQAFLVTAEHLPPTGSGFFYAAWLYNSPSEARVLGRAPPVSSKGQLQAVGALPTDAGKYHQMLITRESSAKPSHPGPVVLNGPFSLH
jgi:Anti-sigma-K factor rskA/Sigma-70, region 4